MSSPHIVDVSIESYAGMAHFYRNGLADFAKSVEDREISAAFIPAMKAAATAIDAFAQKLGARARGRDNDFAYGSRLYSRMLATGEGLDLPLERIISVGQANLDDNLAHVRDMAKRIDHRKTVQEIVREMGRNHPSSETLISDTRDMLEDIRQSLIGLDVISLPSEDRCSVAETPAYMRYAFAAMDSPGPLETEATGSFYYITPAEHHWTPEQVEEWLSIFHYRSLEVTSIHEVYPGHFVHSLHNRYGRPLPLVNRAIMSYAFTEGWAHYAEQMMLEAGHGLGKPELLLTQLLEALVRNCRYMCSIAMHTGDMTVEEATQFSWRKPIWAGNRPSSKLYEEQFDPGYINYTLGKLMILKLREDCRREQNGGFSVPAFHDSLLSYGAPPTSPVAPHDAERGEQPALTPNVKAGCGILL